MLANATGEGSVQSNSAPTRWYVGATQAQWKSFWSAYIGWALDIMDLMLFAVLLARMSSDLGMPRSMAGTIASVSLVATAFGGLIFGFLADRLGRTRSMILSILCYSLGTILCGLSQNVMQLLLFRIVVGLGVGGEWSAGAALITETWPAQHRGKVMAWVQSAFATGYALAAIVTAVFLPLVGWRGVFFFGLAPALLAFWIRHNTPEPEIWTQRHERLTLGATIRILAGEHGRSTLVGLAFTAAAMCGFWGLFTWIPTWLGSPVSAGGPGLNLVKSTTWIIVMQVGAALGFISFGYVADAVGRKVAFLIYFVLSAAAVPIYVALTSPMLLLAFGPVVAFFGTGFYSGFAPVFAELFPTSVRATAQGFIYNTGRAVSALAPMMIGYLSKSYGLNGALAFTSGFFCWPALSSCSSCPKQKEHGCNDMVDVMTPVGFDAQGWLTETARSQPIELSHPMQKGMPIHPAHPPFHITLNNRHGDVLRCCGHSSSNELMVTSTHSATHIDALCHVSDHGAIYGKSEAVEVQRGTDLFKVHGAETIGPIFRRGILLDVARALGVDALDPAYEITVADLEAAQASCGTEIQTGDVVLVRTGWATFWADSPRYLGLNSAGAPGPGVAAGHWLAKRKPFAVGSDTSAFEVMNHHNITLELHMILIAQNGIHIIENLDLEELSGAARGAFAFVALPIRITGATGSPIRPLALI